MTANKKTKKTKSLKSNKKKIKKEETIEHPILKSCGITRNLVNNHYVSYVMTTQGNEVLDVDATEWENKSKALEMLKINCGTLYCINEVPGDNT